MPGSDVDLGMVVSSTLKPFHERHVDYLPVGFPVGLDIQVYTVDEFELLPDRAPGLYQAIILGREI